MNVPELVGIPDYSSTDFFASMSLSKSLNPFLDDLDRRVPDDQLYRLPPAQKNGELEKEREHHQKEMQRMEKYYMQRLDDEANHYRQERKRSQQHQQDELHRQQEKMLETQRQQTEAFKEMQQLNQQILARLDEESQKTNKDTQVGPPNPQFQTPSGVQRTSTPVSNAYLPTDLQLTWDTRRRNQYHATIDADHTLIDVEPTYPKYFDTKRDLVNQLPEQASRGQQVPVELRSAPKQLRFEDPRDKTRLPPAQLNSEMYPSYSRTQNVSCSGRRHYMKVDRFDGKESWENYQRHFEICASANEWTSEEKAKQLSAALTGTARQMLSTVPEQHMFDYKFLVNAIRNRFDPEGRSELYRIQLKSRRQGKSESLLELADDVRQLVDKAYPELGESTRNRMSKDSFLDALEDPEIRTRVLQSRAQTMEDALRSSIELEALQKAERERIYGYPRQKVREVSVAESPESSALKQDVGELSRKLENLETRLLTSIMPRSSQHYQQERSNLNPAYGQTVTGPVQARSVCFTCGEEGHWSPKCPTKQGQKPGQNRWANKECFSCHEMGHLARSCPNSIPTKSTGNKSGASTVSNGNTAASQVQGN